MHIHINPSPNLHNCTRQLFLYGCQSFTTCWTLTSLMASIKPSDKNRIKKKYIPAFIKSPQHAKYRSFAFTAVGPSSFAQRAVARKIRTVANNVSFVGEHMLSPPKNSLISRPGACHPCNYVKSSHGTTISQYIEHYLLSKSIKPDIFP